MHNEISVRQKSLNSGEDIVDLLELNKSDKNGR